MGEQRDDPVDNRAELFYCCKRPLTRREQHRASFTRVRPRAKSDLVGGFTFWQMPERKEAALLSKGHDYNQRWSNETIGRDLPAACCCWGSCCDPDRPRITPLLGNSNCVHRAVCRNSNSDAQEEKGRERTSLRYNASNQTLSSAR